MQVFGGLDVVGGPNWYHRVMVGQPYLDLETATVHIDDIQTQHCTDR